MNERTYNGQRSLNRRTLSEERNPLCVTKGAEDAYRVF